MPEVNYLKQCQRQPLREWSSRVWSDEACDYISVKETNPNPKPWFPKLQWWFNEDKRKAGDIDYRDIWTPARKKQSWMQFQTEHLDAIHDYLDIKPFIPCMMFNISPNWKGKITEANWNMAIKKFRLVIETYLNNCNRYGKWKYVLESGSEDNFLHAHIVAEINPQMLNSVLNGKNSHIRKGNHVAELRKLWDKYMPEGYVGYLKGKFAVQSVILRTETLRDDKLNYLIEENKPEGHKNKRDLGLLFGDL